MASVARLAHISDLHFIESLTGVRQSRVRKLIGLRGGRTYGTEPHAIKKIRALAYKLWELQVSNDLIVATGDLTTDGSIGALQTL